jgi:uncharacterized membrane protein
MFFSPLTLILLIFFLFLPILVFFIQLSLVETALVKLGISASKAVFIIYLSLVGSLVNIPLVERIVDPVNSLSCPINYPGFPVLGPSGKQIIAINVGGAIIPILICFYLLPKAPLLKTIIATAISTFVVYKLARPIPMIGVGLPIFIPPLAAVLLAFLFSPRNPLPVAYISGVMGVLIGADLLNLRCLNSPGVMSIGGAGVFDGIFLVGIISALLG